MFGKIKGNKYGFKFEMLSKTKWLHFPTVNIDRMLPIIAVHSSQFLNNPEKISKRFQMKMSSNKS